MYNLKDFASFKIMEIVIVEIYDLEFPKIEAWIKNDKDRKNQWTFVLRRKKRTEFFIFLLFDSLLVSVIYGYSF